MSPVWQNFIQTLGKRQRVVGISLFLMFSRYSGGDDDEDAEMRRAINASLKEHEREQSKFGSPRAKAELSQELLFN
jgi:hypothetical protein